MNLLEEKLQLIEWLAGVEDEQSVSKVAALRKQTAIEAYEAGLKPMPLEELKERLAASEADVEAGRTYAIEEVEREIG